MGGQLLTKGLVCPAWQTGHVISSVSLLKSRCVHKDILPVFGHQWVVNILVISSGANSFTRKTNPGPVLWAGGGSVVVGHQVNEHKGLEQVQNDVLWTG